MATEAEEIYQQIDNGNDLTPEQAARLLELADEGDTGALALEHGGEPDATPAVDAGQDAIDGGSGGESQAKAPEEPELTPGNAVILAKDGKHTIDYQKLVDAREAAATTKQQNALLQQQLDAANAEMEKLRAAAQQRADNGEAATGQDQLLDMAQQAMDAGVDPGIFGDFSEEDLAKGVNILVRSSVSDMQKMLIDRIKELESRIEPIRQQEELSAMEQHFKTIEDAHPDAESLVESKELSDWIDARPARVRDAYRAVLDSGTASDVVQLFDDFKQSTGKSPASAGSANLGDLQARAKAAAAQVKPAVPVSLSDIPGGTAGPSSRAEALASMNTPDLAEAMEDMSPEQIEAYLNRSL